MLIAECIECNKEYKRIKDGKRTTDYTHGICPGCLEKIKEFRKSERERKRKEDERRNK